MVAIAMHEQDRRNLRRRDVGGRDPACKLKAEKPKEPASKGRAPALFRINRRDSLISKPPVAFQYLSCAVAPPKAV